jgi:hypothetical protein
MAVIDYDHFFDLAVWRGSEPFNPQLVEMLATIFGVSGFVGLLGLEMPVGPFFERRNGKVAACSPAIKSQFKIYMFDHIVHIQCTTTIEAITINHDEIEDKSFIMQR